jgi:hypothetical protein
MNQLAETISGKRIAVVGPSPHLEGVGMGDKIDSYDVVCRLNELLPVGLEKDYGSRSDVLFWSMGCKFMDFFKGMIQDNPEMMSRVQLLVCPRHSLHVTSHHAGNFSPERNVFKNYKSLEIDTEFFHIGDELNTQFETSIGCHPTIGTLALLTLLEYNIRELFVCGMSFYTTKTRYNKYRSKFGGTLSGPPGHNINAEISFLQTHLHNYDNISGDDMFLQSLKG